MTDKLSDDQAHSSGLVELSCYLRQEAEEHLDNLQAGYAALAKTLADQYTMQELYRATFALRGILAMLGYSSPIVASSGLDDCLRHMDQQQTVPDATTIATFANLIELLRRTMCQAFNGASREEMAPLVDRSHCAIDALKYQLGMLK